MSTDPTAAAGSVAIPPSPSERRRVKRPVPGWASVAVLSVCLVGGAWLLWWFVAGSAPRERTVTLKEIPRVARRGPRGSDGPTPIGNMFRQLARTTFGVIVVKADEWHVRAPGDAVMRVVQQPNRRFDYSFYYDRNDLVPPEELKFLVFRAQMVADADAARAAGITPQQMTLFKKLQAQTGMAITPAERGELTGAWDKWVLADAASKPAVEKQLTARLEAIGRKNLDATKQQMSTRAAMVKSTLTPEQLARIR